MIPDEVPAGPIMVDTDVASYTIGRVQSQLALWRPLLTGHDLLISFATVAELLQRGYEQNFGDRKMGKLRDSLHAYTVVPYNSRVAELWAATHHKVRGHLHGQGVNDMWTAACALALDPPVPVASNNMKDFQAIARHVPLRIIHPDTRA